MLSKETEAFTSQQWEEQERFHPFTQYYRDTPEGKKEFANK